MSRIVGRVKALFTTWQGRDLSAERYAIVFLDGFHLTVRLARRVVSVPVLAALGVTDTGQKYLLSLQLAVSETAASWGAVVTQLQPRGLPAPLLLVVEGHTGLKKALERWAGVRVQRCTTHTLEHLTGSWPSDRLPCDGSRGRRSCRRSSRRAGRTLRENVAWSTVQWERYAKK